MDFFRVSDRIDPVMESEWAGHYQAVRSHTDFHQVADLMEMKNGLPGFLWYDAETVVREGLGIMAGLFWDVGEPTFPMPARGES